MTTGDPKAAAAASAPAADLSVDGDGVAMEWRLRYLLPPAAPPPRRLPPPEAVRPAALAAASDSAGIDDESGLLGGMSSESSCAGGDAGGCVPDEMSAGIEARRLAMVRFRLLFLCLLI